MLPVIKNFIENQILDFRNNPSSMTGYFKFCDEYRKSTTKEVGQVSSVTKLASQDIQTSLSLMKDVNLLITRFVNHANDDRGRKIKKLIEC